MKYRRLLSAAVTCAAGFCLVSCGGDTDDQTEGKPEFAETKTKPVDESKLKETEKSEEEKEIEEKERRQAEREEKGRLWFMSQDIDGDGKLSQTEVGNFAWVFLHQADLDEDGLITGDEIRTARAEGRFKRPEPTKVIQILDTDGDGQVGSDELPEGIRSRIPDADVDGDGKVSLVEIEVLNAKQDAERARRESERGGDPNL